MRIQTSPLRFSQGDNNAVTPQENPPAESSSPPEKGDLFEYQPPSAAKVKAHKVLHQIKSVVVRDPDVRTYKPPSYRKEIDPLAHLHDPSDETPAYKSSKKDDLVVAGPKLHQGFHQWDKKEQAKWKKEVAANKTTMGFDSWISRKDYLAEKERARLDRLQRRFDRQTIEIAQGVRTAYSRDVQHLIPVVISYFPVF